MTIESPKATNIRGNIFAAQACSCSCDPCTCGDQCSCPGADAYLGPRWRIVGNMIQSGTLEGIDVSQRIVLHLGQNEHEHDTNWYEVILIDNGATPQQAQALLRYFQQRQGSRVSHINDVPSSQRAAYLVPMRYTVIDNHPTLDVTFSPDRSTLLRGSTSTPFFKEWTYNGRVSVQNVQEI